MEQKETAPAVVAVTVEADTTDVEAATRKCERLAELIKEVNSLLRELDELTSGGVTLELNVKV